jgi:hypothetical protein
MVAETPYLLVHGIGARLIAHVTMVVRISSITIAVFRSAYGGRKPYAHSLAPSGRHLTLSRRERGNSRKAFSMIRITEIHSKRATLERSQCVRTIGMVDKLGTL